MYKKVQDSGPFYVQKTDIKKKIDLMNQRNKAIKAYAVF